MQKNGIIGAIIIIIVVGIGAFWGGMTYAHAGSAQLRDRFAAGDMSAGSPRGRGAQFGGAVFGSIVAKDASSITVALGGPDATSTNGTNTGSKIVLVNGSTQIEKFVAGSASDLTTGESVTVTGSPNADGSITATQIQIRPEAPTRKK